MIEKPTERPKPHFRFQPGRTPGRFLAEAEDLVLGYDSALTRPVSFKLERNKKWPYEASTAWAKLPC